MYTCIREYDLENMGLGMELDFKLDLVRTLSQLKEKHLMSMIGIALVDTS